MSKTLLHLSKKNYLLLYLQCFILLHKKAKKRLIVSIWAQQGQKLVVKHVFYLFQRSIFGTKSINFACLKKKSNYSQFSY